MSSIDSRYERILSRLMATFTPLQCRLEDDSALHAGHAGAASGGSHYRLFIVAPHFENLTRVTRHRLVYDCLDDMMLTEIHALAITALAPSELTA
jgi:BolA protein